MFIVCASGLESLLVEELKELGVCAKKASRGVFVEKILENVYIANYLSRIAMRVLWPISGFACRNKEDLYREARKIEWKKYLAPQKTLAIDANVTTHPNLKNSHFAALVVKDAVCDYFRDLTGERPSIDLSNPDVQLNLFILNGWATLSLDTSGAPLFKRGYRQETGVAPLPETLAAAILKLCHYNSEDILCDPFCGSGTFLIEAAMISTNTPAGFFRKKWGFFGLPEHQEEKWKQIKNGADKKRVAIGKIFGCDKDPKMVEICRRNVAKAGFEIDVFQREVKMFNPPIKPSMVVTNPPFGKRLEPGLALRDLAEFLQNISKGGILSSEDKINIPTRKRVPLFHGGLEAFLHICTS